ncbi:hypothetical protein TSUD_66630 [Trifolium subterraneum]|uniref:Potassium transporter n=1 Tax=Trifolium subterraneum TaxID=3900 RepID=A0A2Z6MMY4_TRISU|nr:hypothetical protein TSUD_66630 [Trifolium subterraneum]
MASRVDTDEDGENKGSMWDLDQTLDQPMDEEAGRLRNMYREKKFSALLILRLAYQSLGVVYGDLGTSPLYVFYNIFPKGVKDEEEVLGALSLIIYSLTLVPLLKYVFVVLRANDNGQVRVVHNICYSGIAKRSSRYWNSVAEWLLYGLAGGTFALYSLLCRHAKIKTIPNQHRTDEELTTYSRSTFHERSFAAKTKRWLEERESCKSAILILVLAGTCMVIGDGILTPAISVLSAVGGIKVNQPKMSSGVVVLVAVIILIGFFSMQHYGTDRVSWLFAPIVLLWFLLIGGIGIFNIWKHGIKVLKAFSPVYIYHYFRRGGKQGWTSLGGIMLSITVWRCHWILVFAFTCLSLIVEFSYFFSVIFKVNQGGWVPLVIAGAFLIIMYVWHYGTVKRYEFEMHSKVSMAWILGLGPSLGLVRVPGIGLVYTELASGVPPIFSHFITNLPAIHSVVCFVCVKYLPVYTVPEEERFLVKRIGPKNYHIFRCVARYGYRDLHKKDDEFEKKLFDNLSLFVKLESMMEGCSDSDEYSITGHQTEWSRDGLLNGTGSTVSSNVELTINSIDSIVQVRSPPPHANITVRSTGNVSSQNEVDELEFLNSCRDAGVVHILGNTVVMARRDSNFFKKVAVDYIYAFLRKICRENSVIFNVPHESLLNVGQIFYV